MVLCSDMVGSRPWGCHAPRVGGGARLIKTAGRFPWFSCEWASKRERRTLTLSLDHTETATDCGTRIRLQAPKPFLSAVAIPISKPFWLNGKYVFDEPTHDFFGVNGTDLLILRHANEGIMIAS